MSKNGAGVDPSIEDVPTKLKEFCDVCECEVLINLGLYDETGMCGPCSTGESVLAYEDQHPRE